MDADSRGCRLGALPHRAMDLGRAMGLDLGRQRAMGLCALALRALGDDRQSLVLGAGRVGSAASLGAGAGYLARRVALEPG